MKRLLITGFEPFGGESINPSWEVVCRLPDVIGEYELTRLCLPVVFGDAANMLLDLAAELMPDVILCIGQAGGRSAITPEMVAINLRHADIPDNLGNQPRDEKIVFGGETAYFSTVPVRKMAESINAMGISSCVSYSAGAYVCNDLLYTLLNHYKNSKVSVGFIHIPYCLEQGKEPSMSIESMTAAIKAAIEVI